MSDLPDILAAAATGPGTLATVVRVDGSSYRLPGARMFVDAAGRRAGTISGGCLEADVARRGRLLTVDRPTTLVRYDASDDGTSDDDLGWSLGLGCNGSVDVLIERTTPADPTLAFLRRTLADRRRTAILHVYQVDGDLDVSPGTRLAIADDGSVVVDPAGLAGRFATLAGDAAAALATGESSTTVYATAGGRLHVLAEAVVPLRPLVVFGGGHDVVPVVAAAKSLGWHVTVCDRRPGHARPDRFPLADAVIAAAAADVPARVPLTGDTAAVVMTHHYPEDHALLHLLLASPVGYVGLLGPRARTHRMLADAPPFPPERLAALHAPVGLDLGGDGGPAVALSIVAEVLAATHGRPGSFLRDRTGSIHRPARLRHAPLGEGAIAP